MSIVIIGGIDSSLSGVDADAKEERVLAIVKYRT